MNQQKEYNDFLSSKIKVAQRNGIAVELSELYPSGKPHQNDIIQWSLSMGAALVAADTGMGKTHMNIITMQQLIKRFGGKALIVTELGAAETFINPDPEVGEGARLGIKIDYVTNQAEAFASECDIIVTNYERVRNGEFNFADFTAVGLDEGDYIKNMASETTNSLQVQLARVKYKFVYTATPSPNETLEIVNYAHVLGIADRGGILTRFFQRNSTKAGELTLHPQHEDDFWMWVSSWAVFIQSLDIDSSAIDCMNANSHYFGHQVIKQSIEDITVLDQPKTDIIIGTYPCTKYSAIADIHGTRTGDNLFLHFFRHIAIEKPEMYIVENVPGMKKFKVVMEAMTKLPDYYVNVFCPVDAANWLPQTRKRLILIGTRKPFLIQPPVGSNNRVRLKDILENNPTVDMPKYVLSRINGKYRDQPIICDPDLPGALAPTCVAHYAKDLGTRLVKDKNAKHGVRPFSIREYARLQGFPDDFKFKEERNSYKLIGNAVAVPMGRWVGTEAMRYFN